MPIEYDYPMTTEEITNQFNDVDNTFKFDITSLSTEAKQSLSPTVIPTANLADTEYVKSRYDIPDGTTLHVWAAGVHNTSNAAPTGLDIWMEDEGTQTKTLLSANTREEGDPIHEVEGPKTVSLRVENDTGSEQNASGYAIVTLEPTQTQTQTQEEEETGGGGAFTITATNDLTHRWALDGDYSDEVGATTASNLTNNVSFVAGPGDSPAGGSQVLEYTGSNSYTVTGAVEFAPESGGFAVSMRISPSQAQGDHGAMYVLRWRASASQNFDCRLESNGDWSITGPNVGNSTSGGSFAAGDWIDVVLNVQSDGTATLYKDGVQILTEGWGTWGDGVTAPFGIASHHSGNKDYFDGKVYDVRIYGNALTESQIQTIADNL